MGRKHSEGTGNRSGVWSGVRVLGKAGALAATSQRGQPVEVPKRKPGRPKAGELPPQAPPLSRQQRRYKERMLAKAAKAWDAATDGTGVVLVDGKEVELASKA